MSRKSRRTVGELLIMRVTEMVQANVGEDAFRSLTSKSTTYDPLPDNGSDTTADTPQALHAEQPPAKKSPYLSRFCNSGQRLETGVGGLWLNKRSRVRARRSPSSVLSRLQAKSGGG